MLIIRKAQRDELRLAASDAFVQAMVGHARVQFPEISADKTDSQLVDHTRVAITEAHRYNLKSKQDICRFINLSIVFGLSWEHREDCYWMHECLIDSEAGTPSMRLNRLMRKCLFNLDAAPEGTVHEL